MTAARIDWVNSVRSFGSEPWCRTEAVCLSCRPVPPGDRDSGRNAPAFSHTPLPGLVLRNSYLWADDAAAGLDIGDKDPPPPSS